MTALIYIFIIMAVMMGMFCMFVIARDVVLDEKERREKKNNQNAVSVVKPSEVVKPADAVKPVEVAEVLSVAPNAAAEEVAPTTVNDDSAVVFSTATQTLEEKYLELTPEYKGYYDEIVKCAMAVEGSKRIKNANYEEYKVGMSRLVRLKIKRGIVVCELVISNLTFKTYVNDNKVAMKQAPASIKVIDAAACAAVKDSIGIAVKAIEEERAYRKEQAKIRRRERRLEARENASTTEE
ncbi:MAG: hypothetical protein IJB32_04135 [Clostridia bacterium]|nr:hypothetical protein [Clostridia bacterium]